MMIIINEDNLDDNHRNMVMIVLCVYLLAFISSLPELSLKEIS